MARKTENSGWICLHRCFRDWQHYGEPFVKSVFIELLLCANHKDGWWQGHRCERGATFVSIRTLAKNTRMDKMTVQRALNALVSSGEIERIKVDQKHTKTIICKYADYQEQNGVSVLPQHTKNGVSVLPQHTKNGVSVLPQHTKQQYNNKNIVVVDNIAHARTHEEIVADMFSSQITIEQFCKNEGLSVEQCRRLADEVLVEWELVGESHRTEKEVKRHLLDHIRKKAEALNVTGKPLAERKAKFLAQCKALVERGFNREAVAEFARYYTQLEQGGDRMLFETYRGWDTETRFLLNQKLMSNGKK